MTTRSRDTAPGADLDRLVEALASSDWAEHEQLEALVDELVPALLAVLEDDDLALETARGQGWAPVHAARILAELGAPEAIEPMLRTLIATDHDDILHDRIIQSLPKIGAPVLEPVLRAFDDTDEPDLRGDLAAILASAGVHDDRVLAILLDQFEDDPTWASHLAEYGDPVVLPELARTLDAYDLDGALTGYASLELGELRDAIERLGGTLTAEQERKCQQARDAANARRQARSKGPLPRTPATRPDRPGRNQPCWCGSGKKYKKCHLAADDLASRT